MALASGIRLGPYEVVGPLGAGGMGEVYRARDTRLGRDVAVKVLPEALAKDVGRLERFEQEARVLGALNHPNLLAIFDVGSADGLKYLVSELLEGKSLRERLQEGPLSARKVADYSTKIANGLAAAHEKGIVHRDLKPENVFVTNDEQVKILDFGLAKYAQDAKEGEGTLLTAGPGATAPGTVMGTVGYMSPEQVRGGGADSRSDIFGFGAILYEMATRKRAFAGETAVETMNAILRSEPLELEAEGSKLSSGMAQIVEHCLEKNPADRFQSARDLGFALRALSGTGPTPALKKAKGRSWSGWMWAMATLALTAAGIAVGYLGSRRDTNGPVVRATLNLPPNVTLLTLGDQGGAPVISPDGSNLVFVGASDEKKMLFLRSLADLTVKPLAGTEGAKFPFWSSDGKSIGFFAGQQLKRLDLAGGPPTTLAPAPDGRGGTWAGDVILFAPDLYEVIHRVSASGGKPVPLTKLDRSQYTTHRWPHFLPDGKHFLYLAANHLSDNLENSAIFGESIDGGLPKRIVATNGSGLYSSGNLLYFRDGSLMTQEFDANRLELRGDATPIGQVLREAGNWGMMASASRNGVLVFQSAGDVKYPTLWFDRAGHSLGPTPISGQLSDLRLSRDGTRAAVVSFEGPHGVAYVCDLRTGVRTRLTFAEDAWFISWSPDGKNVAYSAMKSGTKYTDIYRKRADGAGEQELLFSSGNADHPADWTPDGQYLVFDRGDMGSQRIWILPMSGERKAFPLFPNSTFDHFLGRVSPDGKWIAYASRESGVIEIYVTSFPGGVGKWQVSSGGANPPASWGPDGKELYFVTPDGNLMVAPIQESAESMAVGEVHAMFRSPFLASRVRTIFDIDPKSGQRFIGSAAPDSTSLALNVITNWTQELKKK